MLRRGGGTGPAQEWVTMYLCAPTVVEKCGLTPGPPRCKMGPELCLGRAL